jgi:Domain of unknown function (DUF4159)/Aerotolerance regulator N-terminal
MNALSFITPLALWGLLALPIIWWLLQFTPPRPQSITFPPLRILLSFKSTEDTPDRTPWWLLLLRLAMAALLIIAVAHPQLRANQTNSISTGPLLLIVDDGWAAAQSWPKRQQTFQTILEAARDNNRAVAIATTTPKLQMQDIKTTSATDAINSVRAMQPQALTPDRLKLLTQLKTTQLKPSSVTWLSDGIDAASANDFSNGLTELYGTQVQALTLTASEAPMALSKPRVENGDISVTVLRNSEGLDKATLIATAGNGRILAEVPIDFKSSNSTTASLKLPVELRNEIQSISIAGQNNAGARQLLDDRWHRKTVAIEQGVAQESAQPLLSPMHYVTKALEPFADLRYPQNPTELKSQIDAGLSLLILADIGKLTAENHDAVTQWIEKGGVLLRFAGPRLAAASDDLLPVKLREGDRNLGSALSWESPQAVQPFTDKNPFAGLKIDDRVLVTRQVLAEPESDLTEKTWASLSDGTPLVTAKKQGNGLIVLFHVTANPDWSNLPLSGTFVEMLQRIADLSPAAGSNAAAAIQVTNAEDFAPHLSLSGTGELVTPNVEIGAIKASAFDTSSATASTPAGLYMRANQMRAINLNLTERDLAPISGVNLTQLSPPKIESFAPMLFIFASLLFLLDCLAALFFSGLTRNGAKSSLASLLIIGLAAWPVPPAKADDQSDMTAAIETHLAYVKTGNRDIDSTSDLGLKGLGLIMADRTAATFGEPAAINIETDNLVFYPLLYWPVTEQAETPGQAALDRIDTYMKNGGTIFFDLRESGGDFSSNSGTGEALKRILAKLDIPPLEPVPESHVLTRTFYLLKKFPGRYDGGQLWVEAQSADSSTNNSDGVSGIIIGSNDYAAAWALDDQGQPLNAVIPGSDQQREMAFRVGINIVMYALTGNYKADQVHIPALLERLGQ